MSVSNENRVARRRRRLVVVFMMPLFFSLFGFLRGTQSPQFESYRTLHVIQLLVSGACFGAALTALLTMLLQPRR